ncbi:MAG: hypothetical protein R6Y91_04325 [Desulfohalobium sp.]
MSQGKHTFRIHRHGLMPFGFRGIQKLATRLRSNANLHASIF